MKNTHIIHRNEGWCIHYSEIHFKWISTLSLTPPTLTQISFSIVPHQLTASICIVSNNMQLCCHRKDFTCHSPPKIQSPGMNTWGAPLISSDFDAVTKEKGATSTSTLSPSLASCLCFLSLASNTSEPFSHLYVYTCGSQDTLKSACTCRIIH